MSRIVRVIGELSGESTLENLDFEAFLASHGIDPKGDQCVIKKAERLCVFEDNFRDEGLRSTIGIFDDGDRLLLWCEEARDDDRLTLHFETRNLIRSLHPRIGVLSLAGLNEISSVEQLRVVLDGLDSEKSVAAFEVVSQAGDAPRHQRIVDPLEGIVPYVVVPETLTDELKSHFKLSALPNGSLVAKFRDRVLAYQPSALRGGVATLVEKILSDGLQSLDSKFPEALRKEWSDLRIANAREDGWPIELVTALESAFDNERRANERAREAEDAYDLLALQSQTTAEDSARRAQELLMYIKSLVRPPSDVDDAEYIDPLEYPIKSCQDVIDSAEDILKGLIVTADVKNAARLDRNPLARDWALTAWLALIAVDNYVSDKATGSFEGNLLDWVASERNALGQLTHRMVSYKESESTNANPDAVKRRTFPVPESVNKTKVAYMEPHLKIATKDDFPRIHFFDDTRGVTRKVIIGYFGEHLPTGG